MTDPSCKNVKKGSTTQASLLKSLGLKKLTKSEPTQNSEMQASPDLEERHNTDKKKGIRVRKLMLEVSDDVEMVNLPQTHTKNQLATNVQLKNGKKGDEIVTTRKKLAIQSKLMGIDEKGFFDDHDYVDKRTQQPTAQLPSNLGLKNSKVKKLNTDDHDYVDKRTQQPTAQLPSNLGLKNSKVKKLNTTSNEPKEMCTEGVEVMEIEPDIGQNESHISVKNGDPEICGSQKRAITTLQLRKKVKRLQNKIKRRDQKIEKLLQKVKEYKAKEKECSNLEKVLVSHFSGLPLEFIVNIVNNEDGDSSCRYTEAMKDFSITLYTCSPKAYSFVREHFPLPHPTRIKNWISKIKKSQHASEPISEHTSESISEPVEEAISYVEECEYY